MSRRGIGVGGVAVVLLAAGWWWFRTVPDPSTAAATAPSRPTMPTPSPSGPASAIPTSASPVDEAQGTPPSPGPHDAFVGRLAAATGRLHVRCWLGEEYDGITDVEGGWFSLSTEAWSGQRVVGGVFDGQARVRWDAPEGATSTECTVDPIRWAYLSLLVTDAAGRPASGVAVVGCGALYETGTDGQADVPILVSPEPCTIELMRREGDVGSEAIVRVPPLEEDERRSMAVGLRDLDVAEGLPRYAPEDIEAIEVGGSATPDPLEPLSDGEMLDDLRDRVASSTAYVDALHQVLSETPDAERWRVEEALEDALARHDEHVDALEGFVAEGLDADGM